VLLHSYIYDPSGATPKSGRGARWLPLNNDSTGGDAPLSGRGARWLPLCYHQLGGTVPHRWPGARKQSVASYMRRNAAASRQTPSVPVTALAVAPVGAIAVIYLIICLPQARTRSMPKHSRLSGGRSQRRRWRIVTDAPGVATSRVAT